MESEQKTGSPTAQNHQDRRSASETVSVCFFDLDDTTDNQRQWCCCPFRWTSHHEGLVQWPTFYQRRWGTEGSEPDGREERIGQNRRRYRDRITTRSPGNGAVRRRRYNGEATADAGPRSYSGATPRLSVDDITFGQPRLPFTPFNRSFIWILASSNLR